MKATKLQKLIDKYIDAKKNAESITKEIEKHLKVECVYGIEIMQRQGKTKQYRIAILEPEDFIKLSENKNLIDNPFNADDDTYDDTHTKTIIKSGVFIQYFE